MSDSEEENINDLKTISDTIKQYKKNPATAGMFVSGWDDADQDIDIVENPEANPIDHVLWAAENGKLDILQELINTQPELVNVKDCDGYTPLHRACYENHLQAVSYLLSVNANVNLQTNLGWTPLHSACNWNNYKVTARLLAANANPAAVSDGDQTPLHLASAVSHCRSTLIMLLLREDITEVAKQKNNSGERPADIARQRGIYEVLFQMVLPSATHLRNLAFTCNPFTRV